MTIDAAPALQALIPGCQVDAQVGEQWVTGISALQQLRSSGQLGSVVVVALGTNGPVSVAEFQQMMSVLKGVSRVVFVTNHAPDYWISQNDAMLASEVPNYPTARIAHWNAAATANPQWLYSDDTHMPIGGTGAYAFARLVKAQI
ncbi:MAG: SGNH/GDSL hydrolase family protein [Acidimicrobiales bacterium]